MNNSLHLWSEEISLVEEWISLDSNSSGVKIHFSASEISSGSLDIHSKRSDHWRHYPRRENQVNWVIFLESTFCIQLFKQFVFKRFRYCIYSTHSKLCDPSILMVGSSFYKRLNTTFWWYWQSSILLELRCWLINFSSAY